MSLASDAPGWRTVCQWQVNVHPEEDVPNSQASSSPNREEKERAARKETCCPCTMARKLGRHNATMGILVVNQKPEPQVRRLVILTLGSSSQGPEGRDNSGRAWTEIVGSWTAAYVGPFVRGEGLSHYGRRANAAAV